MFLMVIYIPARAIEHALHGGNTSNHLEETAPEEDLAHGALGTQNRQYGGSKCFVSADMMRYTYKLSMHDDLFERCF
jgi:hypothetical protein